MEESLKIQDIADGIVTFGQYVHTCNITTAFMKIRLVYIWLLEMICRHPHRDGTKFEDFSAGRFLVAVKEVIRFVRSHESTLSRLNLQESPASR